MHRLIAASLAVASCAGVAYAQTSHPVEASSTVTLARALEMAGAVSPALDVASADLRGAAAGRVVAGLRPNPSISVDAENVAGSGPYRSFKSLEATGSLNFPIEMGGKRSARIGVAEARSDRAIIQSAIIYADLRLTVTQAYAEAVAAQQRLVIARDQARIAAEGYRGATVRVQAGRASPIEVERANVTRINADATVERAQRLANVAQLGLSRLTGQPQNNDLDWIWFADVRGGRGPFPVIEGEGTLALAAAQADLAIADASVKLARSQRVPDLTVGAGARYMRESGDTAAVFSLSVPLPLFNNGKAAVDQAIAERQRSEAQQRMTALEVEQAIASAQAEAANAATSALAAKGPALAAAEEAARIARIGYREGKFGQLELLDAERTLSETRDAVIDALLAYHIAQAQLERLTTRAPDLQGK